MGLIPSGTIQVSDLLLAYICLLLPILIALSFFFLYRLILLLDVAMGV